MITTIVLSAGCLHGLMYVGAYEVLYHNGMLNDLRTCVACSAGSIVGLMMCLRFTPREMIELAEECVVHEGIAAIGISNFLNMFSSGGLTNANCIRHVVQKIIRKKHTSHDITLGDLAKKSGIYFRVVATNITTAECEMFTFTTHPTMSVVEAVTMSCNIPVLFTPVKYNNNYYVDGATMNYLPIEFVTDNPDNVLVLYVKWVHVPFESGLMNVVQSIVYDMTKSFTHGKEMKNMCTFEYKGGNDTVFKVSFLGNKKQKIKKEMFDSLVETGRMCMQDYNETQRWVK